MRDRNRADLELAAILLARRSRLRRLRAKRRVAVAATVVWYAGCRPIFLLLPVWLGVRMALNAIDGMLAREFAQKSALGGYLNELADVASDSALYLPFAWLPPFTFPWLALVILLAVLTEFAGILGPAVGASRRYDGPMGKSDRAFIVGALGLVTFITERALPAWPWIFTIAALLTLFTCWNRLRKALAEMAKTSAHGG